VLSRLRHIFSWAIAEGYLCDTPFKRGPVSVVKMETNAEGARTRRLEPSVPGKDGAKDTPSEEERLLKAASPHLRAVITAALTTGCRLGELLSLQWSQVRRDEKGEARWLVLPSGKTKTATPRVIPVGPRLRAELDMRRHAVDGKEHPPTAYIFGDETGGEVKSIRRAWETAVLKAHGRHTPDWIGKGKLSRESRATLRGIDLHFHDLRRQFACTLLESGADLHDVRDFLGHANITTTSRYLQSTPLRLARVLERMETAAGFAHDSHKPASQGQTTGSDPEVVEGSNLLN
jgi:integrase